MGKIIKRGALDSEKFENECCSEASHEPGMAKATRETWERRDRVPTPLCA